MKLFSTSAQMQLALFEIWTPLVIVGQYFTILSCQEQKNLKHGSA